MSLGALLATGVSSALAFTPAGTEIRNQSTATYLDASNTPQIATSNEVINTVAPLYSVVVTPNAGGASGFFAYDGTPALTQVSAPGNVAYYSYILENTGNAANRFTAEVQFKAAGGSTIAPSAAGVEIYYDANGNGFVDAGDILLDNSSAVSTTTTPIVNPGQKIPLVVAVHTPSSATALQQIDTDFQVSGVTGAASDAVSNWNRTTFAPGVGVVTAYKSADVTSVAPGADDITYTIQGSNTGSAAVSSVQYTAATSTQIDLDNNGVSDVIEGILITDILDNTKIDVGANYDNINPITTGGQISPSTAIPLYWNAGTSKWTAVKPTQAASTAAGSNFRVALFIPDADSVVAPGDGSSNPVLSPGQSYKMSFTVDILPGIAATTLENKVAGQYISGGETRDFESNIHIIEIGGDPNTTTVDVQLSPYTFLDGATANNSSITTGSTRASLQHPGVDAQGLRASADTTSAGSSTNADAHRNAGTTVVFPLTLTNPVATSSATDVFNISIISGVPSGWTATLFKADGITPLADTNGDSRPDVGEVVPGGVVDLVVKVVIPDSSPASPGAPLITVQATSVKKSLGVAVVSDNTILRIPEVRPAGVDIATRGQVSGNNAVQTAADATADDDDDLTGASVLPGTNVAYAIQVANIRNRLQNAPRTVDETTSAVDTYQLSVTKVGGAASFDVVLFRDLNGDGILDASELNPISDTGFLSPVATLTGAPLATGTANLFNVLARVTVPAETPAGLYYVDVTATSTNRSAQADTMRLLVNVVAAPSISVIPDNTATVVRGGSVTFKHVVVNTGNTTGTVLLSTAFPVGLFPTGYTAVFVSDTGAILGTDGVTYLTPSLAPNQSQEFYVRIFVPANASVGATVPLTITGNGAGVGATLGAASDSAVDIITVIDGSLDLQKTNFPASGTSVAPGGTIEYTTVFKNLGGASITDVVVFDAIPANTTFVGGSLLAADLPAGVTATLEYSTTSGVSWVAVEPSASSVTNVRVKLVRAAASGVPLNGLLPGETGSFTFEVTVK